VFRGVPGQIAGLDLSSVHSTSAAELNDLTAAAQEQVKQGITAKDEPDAERRLAELTSDNPGNPNLKPTCPPSPTASPSATATAASRGTVDAAPGASGSPTAGAPVPSNSPDALPSDTVPPVNDPTACRSAE
jgi:protein phosphatase